MTGKRPWTENVAVRKCRCGHDACDQYTLSNQGTMGFSEADARLFAASDAMYKALKAHEAWEAKLIHTSLLGRISNAMMDELIQVQELRNTALRAANPDAFGEGDGDASA